MTVRAWSSLPRVRTTVRPRSTLDRKPVTVTATLARLASALDGAVQRGADVELVDVTHDSRQAQAGWLFCAVPGARADGHDHAPAAVAGGASALLVERLLDQLDVPQLQVPDVRAAMGPAAAIVHDTPSDDLAIVGATGTNGKTTTAYLVEGAMAAAGWGTGVIGTVETRIHGQAVPGVRTTPEGPDLQRLLATMRTRGADGVAIEVSSHGLALRRLDGTRVAVAIFTNLSQDHLDFHGTMEEYFAAKARLFTPTLARRGLINIDDPWGRQLVDRATIPVQTFGLDAAATHRIREVTADLEGGRALVTGPNGELEIRTRLLGAFNVHNAVGAVVAATMVGVPAPAAAAGVAACPGVPGRLERVGTGTDPVVLVDYAHTPDAIDRVIAALRPLLGAQGRLHLVVGAGGDRDRGKRPLMGAAATAADVVVLTSDNPRSEPPEAILDDLAHGARDAIAAGADAALTIEVDRRTAIETAIAGAAPGDLVVIAGKGHETGQELADRTIPFDDRVAAAQAMERAGRRQRTDAAAAGGSP